MSVPVSNRDTSVTITAGDWDRMPAGIDRVSVTAGVGQSGASYAGGMPDIAVTFSNASGELVTVSDAEMRAIVDDLLARFPSLASMEARGATAAADAALETGAAAKSDILQVYIVDIARFLAKAMIEVAAEQRQAALDGRLAARESARAELFEQAGSMDKAADKIKEGAIVGLVLGLLGGIVSIAGSAYSAAGQAKALTQMSSAHKQTLGISDGLKSSAKDLEAPAGSSVSPDKLAAAGRDYQIAQANGQLAAAQGQVAGGIGDLMKGAGSSSDQFLQADAKKLDAEGARSAADAQHSLSEADIKKEIQASLEDMIKQMINFIKELRDAEVDAMRALTRV